MDMEQFWEAIAPYVAALGGATGAGTIIYMIIRLLLNKITEKNSTALNSMFDADKLSKNVAEKLAGKTLNIDVTAVTEKALKKLTKEVDKRLEEIEASTNSYRHLLALIGNALTKLKALTDEEVKALVGAIKGVESDYKPTVQEEVMTVKLEPILIDDEESADTAEQSNGVNFGGLE